MLDAKRLTDSETDFRLDNRYRLYFQRTIPGYMVNEIDPLVRGLPQRRYLPSSLIALDIGANRGIWARALLSHSGPYLRSLHLFEPMEGNLDLIRRQMSDGLYAPYDHLLTINPIAMGRREGTLTIHYDNTATFYASGAVDKTLIGEKRIALDKTVEVPVSTIDDYAAKHKLSEIHLVKIDVEGLELDVLKGAEKMLRAKKIYSLIFEFGTHQMGRKEYFSDFWDFLSWLGYTVHKVLTNGRAPQTIPRYSVTHENFGVMQMLMATSQADIAQ